MVQNGRSSRSSWAKSVRSSCGRTVMGKAIWKNPIEVRLGESFQLGMVIRTPWKRIILICVCGWHKTGWKETKTLSRCGKYSIKKLSCENQHLSWIMYTWGGQEDGVLKACPKHSAADSRGSRTCVCENNLWGGEKDELTSCCGTV